MKTPEEVVKFIDDLERRMLRRPSMFASSPESLEEQLMLLENMRMFVLSDQPGFPSDSAYREYCMRVGKLGAASFAGRCRQETWDKLCEFFMSYLASHGRVATKKG